MRGGGGANVGTGTEGRGGAAAAGAGGRAGCSSDEMLGSKLGRLGRLGTKLVVNYGTLAATGAGRRGKLQRQLRQYLYFCTSKSK